MTRKQDDSEEEVIVPTPEEQQPKEQQPLDIAITILAEDEPWPEYLALWRRLLAPLSEEEEKPS